MFKQYVIGGCDTYFDILFNSINEGLLMKEVIYDIQGRPFDFMVLAFNKSFEKMFSMENRNILGKTICEAYPDADPRWIEKCRQVAMNGVGSQFDVFLKSEKSHFRVNVLCPAKGQIITLFRDITDIIRADEALKKHSILFENAHDILLYLKMDGSIVDANNKAIESYGYTHQELLLMKIQQLRHHSTMKDYKEQMELSASKGTMFESIHVRKDGSSFPVEVSSRSIKLNGELIRIHIIRDISERKQSGEKIKYLANHDALTGIPNRGFLMQQFEKTLEQSKRGSFKFAVMLFDVDKFKLINDVHGHNAGDEVLRKIAERLQEAVRKIDIIGRLGGDEFLVIQPFIKGEEDSRVLAGRILDTVATPVKWNNVELEVHLSIGISIYPNDSTDAEELVHCADSAMYFIKQRGGNRYNFFK